MRNVPPSLAAMGAPLGYPALPLVSSFSGASGVLDPAAPDAWALGCTLELHGQDDPRDLGRSGDTRGRTGRPEASIDIEARLPDSIAARGERVPEHHARRGETEVDLSSVGVPAELERDLARGAREELRVVTEEDA